MPTLTNTGNRSAKVLEFLANHGRPASLRSISNAIGESVAYTGAVMGYLNRSGRAKRIKRGIWTIDTHGIETAAALKRGSKMVPKVTYPVEMVAKRQFLIAIARHSRKNYDRRTFDVDGHVEYGYLMELWDQQNGRCALSGIPMTTIRGLGYQCPTNCSMDRIDSNIGYVAGNVQLVCWIVNAMKQRLTNDQVKAFMAAIIAFKDVETLPEEIGTLEHVWQTEN